MTARSTDPSAVFAGRTPDSGVLPAKTEEGPSLTPFEQAVAGVLTSLRPGDVITYGEVAAEAGYPGAARAVGRFLADYGGNYAWWRVVTASGRLVPGHEVEHAQRLCAEGVDVAEGRVSPRR